MTDTPRVRTRFAPSPTGTLTVGNARSALFPWLWARHNGGDFLLRIEDTDQTRYKDHALHAIFDTLGWLELNIDEGPDGPDAPPNHFFQTQRRPLYQDAAQRLIAAGAAYRCYCSSERLSALREAQQAASQPTGYDRRCRFLSPDEQANLAAECEREGRAPVVRLAAPLEGQTTVGDPVRGQLTVENRTLEDIILLKSDGLPTYHLAHIVDDHDMRITHAMRGDEYIPTFPLHILIYRALGWEPPVYVHLPLILDPSGKGKMGKRKQQAGGGPFDPALIQKMHAQGLLPDALFAYQMKHEKGNLLTTIPELRDAGILPEALTNFIALLGWSVGADHDIATRDEMILKFDIADLKESPSAFNYVKLEWMNGHYIRQLSVEELAERVAPFLERAGLPTDRARLAEVLPLVQERMKLLGEAPELLDFFLADAPLPNVADLPGKKMDTAATRNALDRARVALSETDWSLEAIEAALRGTAEALGLKPGQLFQPIRVAITGRAQAPGIFETVFHIGRERVLARLERAMARLDG